MTKKVITISIDIETHKKLKVLKCNISGLVNEFLKNYVYETGGEFDKVDIQITKLEAENLREKLTKTQANLQKKEEILRIFDQNQKEMELKSLQKEKEMIEKLTKCVNCGNMLDERKKSHDFPIGNICKACFIGANGEDIKKWSVKNV